MINFTPVDDKVVVAPEAAITSNVIALPDGVGGDPVSGFVVAVGAGRTNEKGFRPPMETQIGDRVCFPRWTGVEIQDNGEKFIVLYEREICALVDDDGNLLPLSDKVALLPDADDTSAEGIIIPETAEAKTRPDKGKVVAVGPGRIHALGREPMICQVGDRVVFDRTEVQEVRLNGVEYLFIDQGHIFCVANKKEEETVCT